MQFEEHGLIGSSTFCATPFCHVSADDHHMHLHKPALLTTGYHIQCKKHWLTTCLWLYEACHIDFQPGSAVSKRPLYLLSPQWHHLTSMLLPVLSPSKNASKLKVHTALQSMGLRSALQQAQHPARCFACQPAVVPGHVSFVTIHGDGPVHQCTCAC